MRHFEQRHIVASAVPADKPEPGRIPAAAPRGARARLTALLGRWLRRLALERKRRRDAMLLLEMDDHLLKDINLTRVEVRALARTSPRSGVRLRRNP